jgi:Acyl-CoA reductase (LuxC)
MSTLVSTPRPPEVVAPAVVRGELVEDGLVTFGGRGGQTSFRAPDPATLVDRLGGGPTCLRDVFDLPFDEIVEYLDALGRRLVLDENTFLQEALEHSMGWADLTPPLVQASFERLPAMFEAAAVREVAEAAIGVAYLDGWATRRMADGRTASVRAVGARTVHIIAGNSPLISAVSIIRNAMTRSDAIIKAPSNDPLTALAIARTMVEMAPDHPLTRHLSVAYWKGGDTAIEERLYRPEYVEKIIAWGGLQSVRHVTRYIQPGLELITLDPKRSATIIGPEAFADDRTLRMVARRTAADIGTLNQVACVNARVVHVASGIDAAGIAAANRFGQLVYEELQRLPAEISTKAKRFDPELRANIDGLRTSPEWYQVIGGRADEGAVLVSQLDEAVEFQHALSGRVANIVPIAAPADALRSVDAYTQTIGIFPESLKTELRDLLGMHGAQRLVSVGHAADAHEGLPQDGIEPLRRAVKWIVDEAWEPIDA